jgi:serine/threonine protein kinase
VRPRLSRRSILNIVTIYSVEADEGRRFLTMERVEGKTLDQHIPADGLPLGKLFDLALPMADALAEAHAKGITHRDLKPANVMVNEKGQVKILHFGLAKLAEGEPGAETDETAALTQEGLVVGTVRYMSPEQARGEPADHRSEVFSLGVLLYEMATGTRPFQGKSSVELLSSILRDDPPSITEIKNELPNHLGRVVRRCLEKEPDKRYQSALEIRNELEGLKKEINSRASLPGSHRRRSETLQELTGRSQLPSRWPSRWQPPSSGGLWAIARMRAFGRLRQQKRRRCLNIARPHSSGSIARWLSRPTTPAFNICCPGIGTTAISTTKARSSPWTRPSLAYPAFRTFMIIAAQS